MGCIFCEIQDYILDNELVYAVFDKMPVNKGHMLFIVKRHVESFFDITKEELLKEFAKLSGDETAGQDFY